MLRIFMFDIDKCTAHEVSILYRSLRKTFPRDKVFMFPKQIEMIENNYHSYLALKEWIKVAERKLKEIEKRFE